MVFNWTMNSWLPFGCILEPAVSTDREPRHSRKPMESAPKYAIPIAPIHVEQVVPEPTSRNSTPRGHLSTRQEFDPQQSQGRQMRRSSSSAPVVEKPHTMNILNQPYSDVRERYSLGPELGRGQFGIIRVCVERATGTAWACKCISKSRLQSHQDVIDVQREVRSLIVVAGHPNIIGLREVIEDSRRVYMIMELCEGGELFERITSKQRYNEKDAAQVFFVLTSVVEHCHSRGVMHRDLKPENILLVSENNDTDVKVVDFGLAVFLEKGTKLEAMAGSAYYIAPEVLAGSYGLEADIWSLGIILYILLCGMPPFWHDEEEGIFEAIRAGKYDMTKGPWKRISMGAKNLISKILVHSPEERLTLQQIFDHPWLRSNCEMEEFHNPPVAIPISSVVAPPPTAGSMAPSIRPVPLADLSARFRRSNSGDSLASSNFSEFSPRGSRKFTPYDYSNLSGNHSAALREAARKIQTPRGGSGDLPPVYNMRSPYSGEFSGPQRFSGDFSNAFQGQRSADYSSDLRSPQPQGGSSSSFAKTFSLGGSGPLQGTKIPRHLSSDVPTVLPKSRAPPVPSGAKFPNAGGGWARQKSPEQGMNVDRPRTDAKERLRSLSISRTAEAENRMKMEFGAVQGSSSVVLGLDAEDVQHQSEGSGEGNMPRGIGRKSRFSFKLDRILGR